MKRIVFRQIHQSRLCKFWIIVFITFLSTNSCTNNALETALQKAGKNRGEMEKVLKHYQQSPKDSLKYRAARFLIENMPEHISYSDEFINKQLRHGNKLPYNKTRWASYLQAELFYLHFYNLHLENSLQVSNDIETLTSDFLIKHIESVFHQKDSYLWLQDVSFEDFCEYLLPYKINQEEPFLWRDSIVEGLERLNAYAQNYEDTRSSALYMSKYITSILQIPWQDERKILPAFMDSYFADCEDTAMQNLLLYRLCGIPAAIDMIPCWGNYSGRHVWAQPIDKRIRYVKQIEDFNRVIPKVYRRTYSKQLPINTGNEYIPPLFRDIHLKDVTNEYVNTVQVKECGFPKSICWGYLCVFHQGEWMPIAQAANHLGECIFPNMGPGIVYLPAYFDDNRQLIAASVPFRLKNTGEKVYFQAKQERNSLVLYRKSPLNSKIIDFIDPITGVVVKTSQFKDFDTCDTLCYIQKNLLMRPIEIKTNNAHEFLQIVPTKACLIAEIYFLDKDGKRIYNYIKENNQCIDNLQDDNILTSDNMPILSVTLGDSVTAIRILPFNDGNGIYPDDEYELFYFDKKRQWVSCGHKIANDYFIEFPNTPIGALYWLQNLTTGKEERIFTYENNEQRFW